MLNLFPELLTYGLIGPFILRVVIGVLFINLGYLELTREKYRWQKIFETIGFKPATLWTKVFGVLVWACRLLARIAKTNNVENMNFFII